MQLSIIAYIKTEDIYVDIAKDVESRCAISNYELERPFPEGKNRDLIWLMKNELGGIKMRKLAVLSPKRMSI